MISLILALLLTPPKPSHPTKATPPAHIGAKKADSKQKPTAQVDAKPAVKKEHPVTVPANPADALCSLMVSELEPDKVLEILTRQSGANLVLLSKAESKLTIHLKDVPLEEMLRHVCAICELSYLKVGKAYVLATPEKLKLAYPAEWTALHPEVPVPVKAVIEHVTRTYMASYVSGEAIAKSLKDLFNGKDLSAAAGPAQVTPQIGTQDSAKATGSSTAMLTKEGDSTSKMVILSGEKSLVDDALALAKDLDKPRSQVAINVTIHDISNDDLHDLGVTWNFSDISFQESQGKGINFGSFTRSPLTISNALTALDKSGRSKLLAAPSVSLLDGERAFVLIGDRISYPVLIGYSQTNAPIFSKEEERVGIYLQVSAGIGEDGTVTLSLYPQVSSITGYLNVNGASYPQISTREAQTTLRVKSGDTIVMGGLFQDQDIAQVERVPFLSNIPILGEIFKHRKVTKTKSQVIITVQPTILPQPKP